MRKNIVAAIFMMIFSFIFSGCGNPDIKPTATPSTTKAIIPFGKNVPWTRSGYYEDNNGNGLYIHFAEDDNRTGWNVSFIDKENTVYSAAIPQKGKTLRGSLLSGDKEITVTIHEEGPNGVMLVVDKGNSYHFTETLYEKADIIININMTGMGQISAVAEGEQTAFSDDFPAQSFAINLAEPASYVLAAKPDDGWKFLYWQKNGVKFSPENPVEVNFCENSEYVAVFGPEGTDDTHVDLSKATKISELMGLPEYGTSYNEKFFVRAFEQDGVIYRAVSAMSHESSEKLWKLDWEDPEYQKKLTELTSDMNISDIENISENIPSEKDLEKYIGETGESLLRDNWSVNGYNREDKVFYMDHGAYSFSVFFDGDLDFSGDFDEYEKIKPLLVRSIKYDGICNASYIEF